MMRTSTIPGNIPHHHGLFVADVLSLRPMDNGSQLLPHSWIMSCLLKLTFPKRLDIILTEVVLSQ